MIDACRSLDDNRTRHRPLPTALARVENSFLDRNSIDTKESMMKSILSSVVMAASLLSGCISSSNPPPPAKNTTVVVPPSSGTTVVCQNGSQPPCN
jgi:hypothetical protein